MKESQVIQVWNYMRMSLWRHFIFGVNISFAFSFSCYSSGLFECKKIHKSMNYYFFLLRHSGTEVSYKKSDKMQTYKITFIKDLNTLQFLEMLLAFSHNVLEITKKVLQWDRNTCTHSVVLLWFSNTDQYIQHKGQLWVSGFHLSYKRFSEKRQRNFGVILYISHNFVCKCKM